MTSSLTLSLTFWRSTHCRRGAHLCTHSRKARKMRNLVDFGVTDESKIFCKHTFLDFFGQGEPKLDQASLQRQVDNSFVINKTVFRFPGPPTLSNSCVTFLPKSNTTRAISQNNTTQNALFSPIHKSFLFFLFSKSVTLLSPFSLARNEQRM